ncbi:hypothetical protein HY967_03015 [Candidatus Jorgensenbacteria bacterium]|nr:hypothetical protein [Candidatus Jorgensenbacteria bacterium]
MKPIYKIIILFLILVLAGFGIYILFKRITEPLTPGGTSTTPPTSTTQSSETAKFVIKKISDTPIFDFVALKNTKEVYYFTEEGRVLAAKEAGDVEAATQEITALNFIKFGPEEEKVLVAFNNPLEPQWAIFDLIDKVWRPLPAEVVNAAWGVNESELVALIKNRDELNLVRLDLAKNPPAPKVIIRDLRLKDVELSFQPPQTLFIREKPSIQYSSRLWKLDLKTLNFNLVTTAERGLMIEWSTDRSFAFKYAAPDKFFVLDKNLEVLFPTVFNTFPQKCGYAEEQNAAYCFVPQTIPEQTLSLLPDEYLNGKFTSTDDLYKIDVATEEVTRLGSGGPNNFGIFDAIRPTYLESNIYFINRYDNYLYRLELKNADKNKETENDVPVPEAEPEPTP